MGDVIVPMMLICGFFGIMLLVGIVFSYLWLRWFNAQVTKCPECGGVIYVGAWSIACSDCGLEIKRIIKDGKKYRLLNVWSGNKKNNA